MRAMDKNCHYMAKEGSLTQNAYRIQNTGMKPGKELNILKNKDKILYERFFLELAHGLLRTLCSSWSRVDSGRWHR
jgi:hypothetical protein